MIKIISAVAGTALTVGGAGYAYVDNVKNEAAKARAENVVLQQQNAQQAARITGTSLAIDEAIRKLQSVQENRGG